MVLSSKYLLINTSEASYNYCINQAQVVDLERNFFVLKRRAKRRVPSRERKALLVPQKPNQVWSADFMSDALYARGRFRTFNVIDDFNRESLTIEVDTSITAKRLIRIFEILKITRGLPDVLRVDNGPEFTSGEFVAWAEDNGMFIQYIQPGKPNQNAYIERLNRTYREELLDLYIFESLSDVRENYAGNPTSKLST